MIKVEVSGTWTAPGPDVGSEVLWKGSMPAIPHAGDTLFTHPDYCGWTVSSVYWGVEGWVQINVSMGHFEDKAELAQCMADHRHQPWGD